MKTTSPGHYALGACAAVAILAGCGGAAQFPNPTAQTVLGNGREVTEMDALVAYLQVLGTMVDFADPANEHLLQ